MKCLHCGKALGSKSYQHVTTLGEFTVTDATCLAPTCDGCGQVSLASEQLAGYERRAARLVLTAAKGPVSGAVLRYARKALGLRQKDLADVLQCNAQQLSRWEHAAELEMWLRLAIAALLYGIENRELNSVRDVGANPRRKLEIPTRSLTQ